MLNRSMRIPLIKCSEHFKNRRAILASLEIALAISVLICPVNFAIASEGSVTSAELMAILKNAKIVEPSALMRAALTNQEALVSIKRTAKETNKDCKIMAVLFAKALMDAYPDQVLRVKILLFDFETSHYNEIIVRKGDVAAFRSGSLSEEALLGSIEITDVTDQSMSSGALSGGSNTGVVAGPFQDKRLLLLAHIESLSQKGTNVKAFRAIFDQIEELAKQGNETALGQKIPYLFEKLEEQQNLVKQASQVGRQPSVSGSAGNSGSGNSSVSPGSGATGVPSAGDQLLASKLISRRLFLEGAINQTGDDNKKSTLRQRALHIDQLIESHAWKDADKEIATMEKELDVKHPFDFH